MHLPLQELLGLKACASAGRGRLNAHSKKTEDARCKLVLACSCVWLWFRFLTSAQRQQNKDSFTGEAFKLKPGGRSVQAEVEHTIECQMMCHAIVYSPYAQYFLFFAMQQTYQAAPDFIRR